MNKQKVFFPGNLKFLRERKKLSQESVAAALSFTRSKLAALENGATKAQQPEDLLLISEYFKISVDSLLKVDLQKLGAYKLYELESGNDVYLTGSNMRVLAITVDKSNKENVEYVPVKAKAGYAAGHNDPEFISSLPKFSFPNLPRGKTLRMFPTVGDSMLPIPEGSDIICQFVQDWSGLKPKTLCVVILQGEQDLVFKQVSLIDEGMFLLESLNKAYQPYTVPAADILEIWQYHSFQSKQLPQPQTDIQSMSIAINEILADIQILKNK